MATYREFTDGPTNLRIEVEPNGGTGGAGPSLTSLLEAIRAMIAGVAQQTGQIPAEQRPTEMMISFGIRALDGGQLAVGLDESEANFRVTLGWTLEPRSALPDVPLPELPTEVT